MIYALAFSAVSAFSPDGVIRAAPVRPSTGAVVSSPAVGHVANGLCTGFRQIGYNGLRIAGVPVMTESTSESVPAGYVEVEPDGSCPLPPEESYFCNEQGCWIGTPPPVEPVILPDGRTFCMDAGVQSYTKLDANNVGKRIPVNAGVFAPAVKGAKAVMGDKELNKLRGDVIAAHSKVISAFVDTSESEFGQIVLKQMFEAADKDNNGTLDREEVREALQALGFTFIQDKQIDQIFSRGDANGDMVIDFEEFVTEAPKTLRSSLIKLAKSNGHDLGFLA